MQWDRRHLVQEFKLVQLARKVGGVGKSDRFDKAIADFAETCAEQNVRDHAELARSTEIGRVMAETGI